MFFSKKIVLVSSIHILLNKKHDFFSCISPINFQCEVSMEIENFKDSLKGLRIILEEIEQKRTTKRLKTEEVKTKALKKVEMY